MNFEHASYRRILSRHERTSQNQTKFARRLNALAMIDPPGMTAAVITCMKILLAFFVAMLLCSTANARIGETPIQFADRYGPPKDTPASKVMDKNFPLIEGAIHHTYEYEGWRIRAAFLQLDGPAVRMDFQKFTRVAPIKNDELEAIMSANTPTGTSWQKMMYDNPDSPNKGAAKIDEAYFASVTGQKMWRRSDGAILWLRSNLIIRLELPIARDYERQSKLNKHQKDQASVPSF